MIPNIHSKQPYMYLLTLATLLIIGLIYVFLQGCSGDDGECLSWGENCSQSYKLDNYGTTEIQCCEGTCRTGTSGYLVCGS